jgi:WD40 repeat protein
MLTVWELPSGSVVSRPLDLIHSFAAAFSPDNRLLACGGQKGIEIFETTGFQRRLFIRGDKATSLAFSPDGRLLAFPSNQHGLVRLWDIAANREAVVLKHPGAPHTVAFSKDGQYLVTADLGSLRIWGLNGTGEKQMLLGTPTASQAWPLALAARSWCRAAPMVLSRLGTSPRPRSCELCLPSRAKSRRFASARTVDC